MEHGESLFDVENRQPVLTLGIREIIIALCLVAVLIGTFGGVAYVVGRTVMPAQTLGPSEQLPEPALVIEAPKNAQGAGEPIASSDADNAAAEAAVETPPNPGSIENRQPEPGRLYFQVAAADLGVAEVFVEYLERKRFPGMIAEGPDERNYRVLVGPIQTDRQVEELRAGLEAAGFKPFLRRYSGNGVDVTALMYGSDREHSSTGKPQPGRTSDAQGASI